jgi:hypothetical protein
MIRKFLVSLLALVFHQTVMLAQTNTKDKNDLAAGVEQLRQLMITPDSAKLHKILSKDLSYGHSNGKVEDKRSFISSLMKGESDFVQIEIKELSVAVNNNIAIVRHQLLADTNDKGKGPGTVRLGVMLVWQKQKNKTWQLLARQAFKL